MKFVKFSKAKLNRRLKNFTRKFRKKRANQVATYAPTLFRLLQICFRIIYRPANSNSKFWNKFLVDKFERENFKFILNIIFRSETALDGLIK